MDNEKLIVVDENGKEIEMEILFTFESDPQGDDQMTKQYVLYYDPLEEGGNVYAATYTDDGKLNPIEDEKEWDIIEEVFATFMEQADDEEDHHHHDHD